jgi:pimeloyl-ACP methyl ester carboxylesterase
MHNETPPIFPTHGVSVVSDNGAGRTYVVIVDDTQYLPLAQAVAERLSQRARSVVIASAAVTNLSWSTLSVDLARTLSEVGVRQASLIGCGAGATLAQNVALEQPRFVRSLVVVDASARPHPSLWERIIDRIEERLPFGLPLRLGSGGFNVKAYLHRFRCPLLVVSTHRASSFTRGELQSLSRMAPTAWLVDLADLSGVSETERLAETVELFQDTPVKCPQKNLKGAA